MSLAIDFDSMPAGAEMDALVTERVFLGDSPLPQQRGGNVSRAGEHYAPPFMPSSELVDSELVVHTIHLREQLAFRALSNSPVHVQFGHERTGSWITIAEAKAPTLALAICRAALKAVAE